VGLGFWEALIVLPILMLATAFGLTRLSRFIQQLRRTEQRQPSLESQYHPHSQITDYKPYGWMDEELARQKRNKVRH
jgi:hypothetical protein